MFQGHCISLCGKPQKSQRLEKRLDMLSFSLIILLQSIYKDKMDLSGLLSMVSIITYQSCCCAPGKDYTLCIANQSILNSYSTAVKWDNSTICLHMKEGFLPYLVTSFRVWLCNLNTSHAWVLPRASRDYVSTRWLKSKHCYWLILNLSFL